MTTLAGPLVARSLLDSGLIVGQKERRAHPHYTLVCVAGQDTLLYQSLQPGTMATLQRRRGHGFPTILLRP
jgi:hypothetical protein